MIDNFLGQISKLISSANFILRTGEHGLSDGIVASNRKTILAVLARALKRAQNDIERAWNGVL